MASNNNHKECHKRFGKYIKDIRVHRARLSGAEAARSLRLKDRQRLYNYENGRTLPSTVVLIKMAQVYNVKPEEIIERAYWPQLVFLPLVSIVNYEELSLAIIEAMEKGLEEEKRKKITQFIINLFEKHMAVS